MRLEISLLAARDLRELHLYGLGRYGPSKADAYLADLFASFEHIMQWPLAARERLATRPPVRLVRRQAHNVLYCVEHETVTILRVFHHSANWIDYL
jgi:toxin ParE1/3/4